MGGGVSKRVVPTFTVSIVFNNDPVTIIDVAETATLSEARKEVEKAAEEFKELPQHGKFYFLFKGLKCTLHKESTRTVRDAAGPDSLLIIVVAGQTKVVPAEETEILDTAEEALDTADEIAGGILGATTEETQKVEQDGTITTESNLAFQLDDTSMKILGDVMEGIDAVASVIPAAKLFVGVCKTIYDRCQEPSRLRAEILDFLHFIKGIETAVVSALKNFQTKDPLVTIQETLEDASKLIEASQKRTGFKAWWCAKADRESLQEAKDGILKAMDIAKFTMQVNMKEDLASIMKKDALLYQQLNCDNESAAMEKIKGDEALREEMLSHLKMNEEEFNALKEGQTKLLQNQEKMMKSLSISAALKTVLDPLRFDLEIDGAVERFHEGTREWAFADFDNWSQNQPQSRVSVLSGDAGMGKTGIMSKLVRLRTETILAHHFCRHDDSRKRDPKHVLCSMAYQIALKIPEYKTKLEGMGLKREQLFGKEMNATALFHKILGEPLASVKNPFSRRQIVLIDALDECDHDGKNDLLNCIRDHFLELPDWVACFMTTRPEVNIMHALGKFHPEPLVADSEKNMNDICLYVRDSLTNRISDDDLEEGVRILGDKSKGVFIYARYAVEKLNPQDTVSLDELRDFPDGITGFYGVQFKRLLGEEYESIGTNAPMWRIVEAVMAAREPLHVEALDCLVRCTAFERKSAVAKLSMLFPVRDHRLHVFHKSVKDWLVNSERKEDLCYVGVQGVHKTLGKRCHEVLREALENDEANEASTYALKHCISHLCEGGGRKDARGLMFRLEYLEERAKLGPALALVQDGNRIGGWGKDKPFELLCSAVKLSQPALQRDPAQACKLVGA